MFVDLDNMKWGNTVFRTMYCPYCGYTFKTGGIGRVWCGPHREEGNVTSPAVQMREKKT